MTRLFAAVLLGALCATAAAQPAATDVSSFNPEDAIAPVSSLEGPGIKIGEGSLLHPVFGVESGYISNVFYTHDNVVDAALIRVLAQIGTGTLNQPRLAPSPGDQASAGSDDGALRYRADLRLAYDAMLSGSDTISSTGGLSIGGSAHGMANPLGPFSFQFDEDFQRLIRAANFESTVDTDRDVNALRLALLYHPQGRSVAGYLYYSNLIDVFEASSQSFANRWGNQVGIHPMWQWLPETQFYLDISEGLYSGIGADAKNKATSYPLLAKAGVATLLSFNLSAQLEVGYTNGFYSTGPSYSGVDVNASVGYRYANTGRALLTYQLLYNDSINANFYRDHVLRLELDQNFAGLTFMARPELYFRNYQGITVVMGPPSRDDVILSVVAGAHYNFKNWLSATLDYRLTLDSTDYRYGVAGFANENPSYTRHEILLGLRLAM